MKSVTQLMETCSDLEKSQRACEKNSEFRRKIFSPLSETVLFYRGVPILDLSFTPVYAPVFVPEAGALAPGGRTPYRNDTYVEARCRCNRGIELLLCGGEEAIYAGRREGGGGGQKGRIK